MRRRITHRNEVYGGRWLYITIAMPLDPAIGFAMVGFFFEDWLPHEYYSYACIWLLSAYLFICLSGREKKVDVSCPAFEFIYTYFSFTLS